MSDGQSGTIEVDGVLMTITWTDYNVQIKASYKEGDEERVKEIVRRTALRLQALILNGVKNS